MSAPVTAILVSFNSAAVIGKALESLPPGVAAVVVDNASEDASVAIAEAAGAAVILNVENIGFGAANNLGLAQAQTPYVLFLNPDATLQADCLERLVAAAERRPDAALLVPTILKADGSRFEKWGTPVCDPAFRAESGNEEARSVAFASGAVVLARREAMTAIGGFDPAIFLYFEDDDLSRRVLDRGWRILHVTDAVARHVGNISSPTSDRMIALKHWHLAWSERHVRLKHGLPVFSRWRILESLFKLGWARLRGDAQEAAKQRGLIHGTLAALRGVAAQAVRGRAGAEETR